MQPPRTAHAHAQMNDMIATPRRLAKWGVWFASLERRPSGRELRALAPISAARLADYELPKN